MIHKKIRWLVWSGVIVFTALVMCIYWVISLFTQLDMVTAQRVLNKPVCYYSDILSLKKGQSLTIEDLENRLLERGYRRHDQGDLDQGGYRFLGTQSMEAFFRPFIAPDGRAQAGLYRFTFTHATLSAIEQPPSKSISEIMLEPLQFGDTRPGGAELRAWVRLEKVPRYIKDAVLDSEDRRFYTHYGVDPIGIARAFFVDMTHFGVRQG
ncbi:MAG: transglycosylase domain-containing protein, partial [Endomicrobiales bacterium]